MWICQFDWLVGEAIAYATAYTVSGIVYGLDLILVWWWENIRFEVWVFLMYNMYVFTKKSICVVVDGISKMLTTY